MGIDRRVASSATRRARDIANDKSAVGFSGTKEYQGSKENQFCVLVVMMLGVLTV